MIELGASQAIMEPVRKNIRVRLQVETAFRLFTEGFGRWWPMASHSVSLENAAACYLEDHLGGRIYEVDQNGRQFAWGRVLAWEPPHRLLFSWYPGRDASSGQEVEIIFQPDEAGGARIELIHRGWEKLGEQAAKVRENYVTGWDYVLGKYREKSDE